MVAAAAETAGASSKKKEKHEKGKTKVKQKKADKKGAKNKGDRKVRKAKKKAVEVDAVAAENAAKRAAPVSGDGGASDSQAGFASEPAAAGDGGDERRSRSSISLVPPQTAKYLAEVTEHFKGLIDDEERGLLVANVLEEIAGKEALVAGDPQASRQLEVLLVGANPAQLIAFMQAVLGSGGLSNVAARCVPRPLHEVAARCWHC
jgi:hypothetical protein